MIAIDLGSNTIRFVEFDGEKWGESFEKIVRTAEGLHQTQLIGERATARIIDAIEEAKTKLNFLTQPSVGYTTAAMRMASNADEVLERIYQTTGVMFRIIDAKKEAELTLRAVRYRLAQLSIDPLSFILADIGGGSTELIHFWENQISSDSLNIGIVTLSESALSKTRLDEKINLFKTAVRETLQEAKAQYFILTAGTPTTIAAYLNGMDYETYDPTRINGYRLRLEDCYRAYDDLLSMSESDRTRYVGVGRENLIIAGILMVTSMYEALGYSEAIVIDDGLGEGIALEYCNQP